MRGAATTCVGLMVLILLRADPASGSTAPSQDCNGNGVPDRRDTTPDFLPGVPELLAAASLPKRVVLEDFDSDGDPDVAVAEHDRISLVVNEGDGRFAEPAVLAAELETGPLFFADVDGDGDPDLVAAGSRRFGGERVIAVIRNRGDGSFDVPLRHETRALESAHYLVPLDLDADGDLDFAASEPNSDRIALLENRMDGIGISTKIEAGDRPLTLRSADFDGDHQEDLLLLGDDLHGIFLLRGRGDGTVAEPVELFADGRLSFDGITDIDADGRPDLVVTRQLDDRVTILRNTGSGLSVEPRDVTMDFPPGAVLPVDMNGDGALDLVVGFFSEDIMAVALRRDDGGFGPSRLYYTYDFPAVELTAGDIDGDGDQDLVVPIRGADGVFIYRNTAEGRFPVPVVLPSADGVGLGDLEAADFDGDGYTDLIVTRSQEPQVSIWLSDGSGGFEPGPGVAAGGLSWLEVPDIDADGDVDLVVAGNLDREEGAVVFLNRGGGVVERVSVLPTGGPLSRPACGDFDGDGLPDLALPVTFPAGIRIWLNRGGGSFQEGPAITWRQVVFSPTVHLTAGDFDGDGLADLVASSGENLPPTTYLSLGDGRFRERRILGIQGISRMKSADVDGDGRDDLIAPVGGLGVYRSEGLGQFADVVSYGFRRSLGRLAVSDLDGNGIPDVIAAFSADRQSADPGGVAVFLGNGGGGFLAPREYLAGSFPWNPAGGDFDGDGVGDVAVTTLGLRFGDRRTLNVLFGVAKASASEDRNGNGEPDECESLPFHRGDANADGSLDLSDGVYLLSYLFLGGPAPVCMDAADVNDDAQLDCSDAVFLLSFLFLGGEPPSSPGPPRELCGSDRESRILGDLGCRTYDACDV